MILLVLLFFLTSWIKKDRIRMANVILFFLLLIHIIIIFSYLCIYKVLILEVKINMKVVKMYINVYKNMSVEIY